LRRERSLAILFIQGVFFQNFFFPNVSVLRIEAQSVIGKYGKYWLIRVLYFSSKFFTLSKTSRSLWRCTNPTTWNLFQAAWTITPNKVSTVVWVQLFEFKSYMAGFQHSILISLFTDCPIHSFFVFLAKLIFLSVS
jgi:hypothetical protein